MSTFLRNTISRLYNAVSEPVAATQDVLAERLESVPETASLLYSRMMDNTSMDGRDWKTLKKKRQKKKRKSNNKMM